jgi:bifunctional DNA-binding transcriptional regulator/antitoxin component of YhaV-PrlF toxin-antitoxin module
MARTVKNAGRRAAVAPPTASKSSTSGRSASAKAPVPRTRISSKHQVTIGKQAFDQAGLKEGDVVAVRALGPGRVELTRLDELFAKHRGRINTGGQARQALDELRDEWL